MPFVSKKQMKLCYILQKQGKNKNWDCQEWSQKTDYSSLPEYVQLKSRSKIKEPRVLLKPPSLSKRSRSRSKSRSKSRK